MLSSIRYSNFLENTSCIDQSSINKIDCKKIADRIDLAIQLINETFNPFEAKKQHALLARIFQDIALTAIRNKTSMQILEHQILSVLNRNIHNIPHDILYKSQNTA